MKAYFILIIQLRIRAPKNGTLHQKSTSAGEGALRVHGRALKVVEVDCYPLYDIIVACNIVSLLKKYGEHFIDNNMGVSLPKATLDVLFLDVQGPEYSILKTLPWDRVEITVSYITKRSVMCSLLSLSRCLDVKVKSAPVEPLPIILNTYTCSQLTACILLNIIMM